MTSFGFLLVCVQACLIKAALSQYMGAPCAGPLASPYMTPFTAPGIAPFAPGLAAPFGTPYGLAGPYGWEGMACAAPYGGAGTGNCFVAGELPIGGATAVAGQVPIIGGVEFGGAVPAAGAVTITGACACGCGPYGY